MSIALMNAALGRAEEAQYQLQRFTEDHSIPGPEELSDRIDQLLKEKGISTNRSSSLSRVVTAFSKKLVELTEARRLEVDSGQEEPGEEVLEGAIFLTYISGRLISCVDEIRRVLGTNLA